MHPLHRIAFHAAIGLSSALDEVEQWAEQSIKASDEHAEPARAVLSAPRRDRLRLFERLVCEPRAFQHFSKEAADYAQELLPGLCQRVLDGSLTLSQFCGVIQNIDNLRIDRRADEIVLPEGLHELWNACDWCDESWTRENQPAVMAEIEKVLRRLTG